MTAKALEGDCLSLLTPAAFAQAGITEKVCLTFLDPPFNQGKDYNHFDDDMPEERYWQWMADVCARVRDLTADGGAIYFMQREKNTEAVLRCLRETGWTLQNPIIWTKRTSAVPNTWRFGKQYQIIAFATKGRKPHVFHRLRIDLPIRPEHKYEREDGVFVTDVWEIVLC
jgi:DNA modification methylase